MNKKLLLLLLCLGLIPALCVCGSSTSSDEKNSAEQSVTEARKESGSVENEQTEETEQTETKDPETDNQYYYAEKFIEKYNDTSDNKITVTTRQIKEDKRLHAFDGAPTIYGQIGDIREGVNNTSVMRYRVNSYFKDNRVPIRFEYNYDRNLEVPKTVLESVVKLMDSSITDDMIQTEIYDHLDQYGEVNAQYIRGDNCEVSVMITTLSSGVRELFIDGSIER